MPILTTWTIILALGVLAVLMLRAGWRETYGGDPTDVDPTGADRADLPDGRSGAGEPGSSFVGPSSRGRSVPPAFSRGSDPGSNVHAALEPLDDDEVSEILLALEASALLPEPPETTRFGEPIDAPRWSARLLRALAARHGLGVRPAETVDEPSLAAAVIAADAMMLVTGATRLDEVGAHSTGAARTFARVLFRAAGGDVRSAPRMHLPGPAGGHQAEDAAEVARYTEWAIVLTGTERAAEVLRLAAEDLSCDTSGGRFVELAEMLEEAGDQLAVIGRR
jgi:hypothetical protein